VKLIHGTDELATTVFKTVQISRFDRERWSKMSVIKIAVKVRNLPIPVTVGGCPDVNIGSA
jgi:hypothetical protein